MRIAVLAYNLVGAGGLSVGSNAMALLRKISTQRQYLMLGTKEMDCSLQPEQKPMKDRPIKRMGTFFASIWLKILQTANEYCVGIP